MIVLRVIAFAGGLLVVVWVGWSAIRIIVVPRGEQVWLGRSVFLIMREIFEFVARRARSYEAYDRIMALKSGLSAETTDAEAAFAASASAMRVGPTTSNLMQ